jgi:hypothetical protein
MLSEQLSQMSLEEIGHLALLSTYDGSIDRGGDYDECCKELGRRVDHDTHKALALFDYHAMEFKKTCSTKRWNELSAMMALVQYLRIGANYVA